MIFAEVQMSSTLPVDETWHFPATAPAAAALLWFRKLIDGISRFWRKPPGGRSPGTEPDGAAHYDPWEDPAIWLLMWH